MTEPSHHRIDAFGIALLRLAYADIELVRLWRNSPNVNQWMEFKGRITPEMQRSWFEKLDPETQFFYVIELHGERVGLVNLKNVQDASAEGGIFIAEERFQNGTLGLQAILAMYDFGFQQLYLTRITAHIMADNPRAIRFNQALGFKQVADQDRVANRLWTLSPSDYKARTSSLRAYLQASS